MNGRWKLPKFSTPYLSQTSETSVKWLVGVAKLSHQQKLQNNQHDFRTSLGCTWKQQREVTERATLTIAPTSPFSPFSPGGPGKPCKEDRYSSGQRKKVMWGSTWDKTARWNEIHRQEHKYMVFCCSLAGTLRWCFRMQWEGECINISRTPECKHTISQKGHLE